MRVSNFNPEDRVNILGVGIDVVPVDQLINFICQSCRAGNKVILGYVNVHALNLAYSLPWFRKFLNSSNLVFCDGFGVKWASEFLYHKTLYRHTPPDWIPLLAENFFQENLSMYFLGAKPGVTDRAAAVLCSKVPGLKILGVHHGYFNKTVESQEQREILKEINDLRPDLLMVGFGMPYQEQWIAEHCDQLNVKVILPVGAMFDYLSGAMIRSPQWITDFGLEWLGRLVLEPGRLWRRYIIGNPLFILRVILQKIGFLTWK